MANINNDGNLSNAFPPKFRKDILYPQEYNLDKLEMPEELTWIDPSTGAQNTQSGFGDMPQGSYFYITFPPTTNTLSTSSTFGYGKHYFYLYFNALPQSGTTLLPRLKAGSKILFEFKDAVDSNGEQRVIFSDLTPIQGSSNFFIGYIWLKEDPLRTYENISNGIGTLNIVGKVNTINSEWANKYNVRTTINFNLDLSPTNHNTSPILFKEDTNSLNKGLFISESLSSTENIPEQSYAHISSSRLTTWGGELKQAKISLILSSSYALQVETNSQLDIKDAEWNTIALHNMGTGTDVKYENDIDDFYSQGINPESEIFKIAIPAGSTLPRGPMEDGSYEKVKFKITYTNSENSTAQNLYSDDQTEMSIYYPNTEFSVTGSNAWVEFTGSAHVFTGEGNAIIMSGQMTVGNSFSDGVIMGTTLDSEDNRVISFTEIVGGTKGATLTTIGKAGIIINEGNNQVQSSTGTNISGLNNRALNSNDSTILSALSSSITGSERATILAGKNNSIQASPQSMIIGSDDSTLISGSNALIIGGEDHTIHTLDYTSDIGKGNALIGGKDNTISGSFTWRNVILGGDSNQMLAVGHPQNINIQNVIAGGASNIIHSGQYSFIGGGRNHTISDHGLQTQHAGFDNALIAGFKNHISGGVKRSVVIGGTGISASLDDTVYVPNLNVRGSLTTTSITSSIITSSVFLSEGSNTFGDAITDAQTFTGHITASGNISSSGTVTTTALNVFGAPGTSGRIYINDGDDGLGVADGLLLTKSGTNAFIYNRDGGHLEIGTNNKQQLHIEDEAAEGTLKIKDSGIEVASHITASGNISGSSTSDITIGGNLYAKTFSQEKINAFFNPSADGTYYYFPIGANAFGALQGVAAVNPLSGFQYTAMCNVKITKVKLTFFYPITNMGTLSIKLQKYDGSGDPDGTSNFADVGTVWEVTDADVANGDRAYHAPSDWLISAGENFVLAFNSNTSGGQNNFIWFTGGITMEEDWNNPVTS